MKPRFRMYQRGCNGRFYLEDNTTGKQESLGTSDRDEALCLLHAHNEAQRQPALNAQLARAYLVAGDPQIGQRTWQGVMDAILRTKVATAPRTRERYESAFAEAPFNALRQLALIETRPTTLLEVRRRPLGQQAYPGLSRSEQLCNFLGLLPVSVSLANAFGLFLRFLVGGRGVNGHHPRRRRLLDAFGVFPHLHLPCFLSAECLLKHRLALIGYPDPVDFDLVPGNDADRLQQEAVFPLEHGQLHEPGHLPWPGRWLAVGDFPNHGGVQYHIPSICLRCKRTLHETSSRFSPSRPNVPTSRPRWPAACLTCSIWTVPF